MKVTVFGATGFIGKRLMAVLQQRGHAVTAADMRRDTDWEKRIEQADVVVNLAGSPIFGPRWDTYVKAEIHRSRIEGTRHIVESLAKAKNKDQKERALINASAIGYYGPTGDEVLNEDSPAGSDFLAFVCREWEEEAFKAHRNHQIRTVAVRTGVVLGKGGGALSQLLTPFKLGLGGRIGNGQQWFSWIELEDQVALYVHAVENKNVHGVLNGTAPNPVRNKEFTKVLGKVLHRPTLIPIPPIGLYLLFGEASEMLANGQRVHPPATLASGFVFKYPTLEGALRAALD